MSRRRSVGKRTFPIVKLGVVVLLLVIIGISALRIAQKLQIVVVQQDDTPAEFSNGQPQQPSPPKTVPGRQANSPSAELPEPEVAPDTPEPVTINAAQPPRVDSTADNNAVDRSADDEAGQSMPTDQIGITDLETIAESSPAMSVSVDEQQTDESVTPERPVRTWTDSRGRFTVEAKLIEQTGRSVTLQRADNGKQVTILIRRLSKADREFLKNQIDKTVDQPARSATNETKDSRIVARVIRVSDGDTIDVADRNGNEQRIRFHGIDAPEYTQKFGREARSWLAKRIDGETVKIELVEKDRYDRWTANIYHDDLWINLGLIQQGYAWHYHRYSDNAQLASAQRQAQANRLGIWRDNNPLPPWKYRELNRESNERIKPRPN